jgi:hypothetical protein
MGQIRAISAKPAPFTSGPNIRNRSKAIALLRDCQILAGYQAGDAPELRSHSFRVHLAEHQLMES